MSESNKETKRSEKRPKAKVLVIFGTRPEAIKCAPVIQLMKERNVFEVIVVSSSQHTDLLAPFIDVFGIKPDYDLKVMSRNQNPNQILAKTVSEFDTLLELVDPQLIIVQGDTSTTLAGAVSGFNRDIPVAHLEAGLRTGNLRSPFPEEMNRRLTSKLASFHFAATPQNRQNLIKEGISDKDIFVTGNTIVDALNSIRGQSEPSADLLELLEETDQKKRILLTTHRRESFRTVMRGNLEVIRDFIAQWKDTCLIFPVHPNPNVRNAAEDILGGQDRVHLIDPLDYNDFIHLMERSFMIVSDSGGIQEEAPTLGKPVLILRENTERPEAVQCGVAKLVGKDPSQLKAMLEQNYLADTWVTTMGRVLNPFGDGQAAARICDTLEELAS